MSRVRFTQIVHELASHTGLGSLASEVLALNELAFISKDFAFPRPGCATLRQPVRIAPELSQVGEFDVRSVLSRGAQSSEELDLLGALTLLGVAASWPSEVRARLDLTRQLLWLETHSGLSCLSSAGLVLDSNTQSGLAEAFVRILEEPGALELGESTVARAWLATCTVPECQPWVERANAIAVVAPPPVPSVGSVGGGLHGDLGPTPRHCAVTALLAFTTLLFFARATRAVGQLALRYRRPARLVLGDRGLELESRHELLGRVLKERRQIIPLDEIRQVVREVRYPRLGLYAGLIALTLGTLIGTRLFVDGLRVTGLSFTMMVWGALVIVLGLGLDLALTGLSDGVRGKCRLVIQTRGSGSFSLGTLNPSEVDRLLSELSLRLKPR